MTKKTKVGVVGVGYLGQIHAKIYHEMENVDLVMLADTDIETAKKLAEDFSCQATDNYLDTVSYTHLTLPTKA